MNAVTIIILVVAVALMLVPAALVWYINIGGVMLALKEAREKRAAEAKTAVKA
jgi:hypothetical protein